MASHTFSMLLLCKNTVLAEKKEVLLKTTYHPTFKVEAEFGESKDTRKKACPFCHKQVKYKAFCYEFSLKKALIWPGIIIVAGILLFGLAFFLFVYGGWDIDPAMWYFGVWGIIGFFGGIILLAIQVGRYLVFYRKNKHKYIFAITGFALTAPKHIMKDGDVKASWRHPPI